MRIKIIEEYRDSISKQPNYASGMQGTNAKYFVAGFLGAAKAARSQVGRANGVSRDFNPKPTSSQTSQARAKRMKG